MQSVDVQVEAHTHVVLPSWIAIRHPEAVKSYLARYPADLIEFLKSAWPHLVECFGEPVEIILEVMTYPDEGSWDELVGWIQSPDSVAEGLAKLERFEDEWFLDHLEQIEARFNFNIETP